MRVLVVGSGGREHSICWSVKKSSKVSEIFCAPGNAGIASIVKTVNIKADNIDALLNFALKEKIDLTIVGPEQPLAIGIVDLFRENGLLIFGPNKFSSQLESSKEFSKIFESNILVVELEEPFIPRRGRINCSLNEDGKWKWFGTQFTVKKN